MYLLVEVTVGRTLDDNNSGGGSCLAVLGCRIYQRLGRPYLRSRNTCNSDVGTVCFESKYTLMSIIFFLLEVKVLVFTST